MVRTATIEDAFRIAEIQVSAWRAAYRDFIPAAYLEGLRAEERERTWRRFVGDPDSRLLVAAEGDKLTGFCHVSSSRDPDARITAEIIAIYVDPPHWGKGIGKALCRSAFEFAQARGFVSVTLWTLVQNRPAQCFYEALGFRPDGATKTETLPGFVLQECRYRRSIAD